MTLAKTAIRVSPISNRILLARFGRDPHTALETKDIMSDFWQALIQYAFDGKMPAEGEAAEVSFGGGDEQFVVSVTRVPSHKAGAA